MPDGKNKYSRALRREFYTRDVLEVAPDMVGKLLVVAALDGKKEEYRITETEAYRGNDDKACHASRGRTPRTEIMYHAGGHIYVYLIYGIHWMLNVVTGEEGVPQAVLIRGIEGFPGPGRLSKILGIDRSYYGLDLVNSGHMWVEDDGYKPSLNTGPRIGIDYAGYPWTDKEWRFMEGGLQ